MNPTTLPFSQNWNNKLGCLCFSTIRLYNLRKYDVGKRLDIVLNRKLLGTATVQQVKSMYLHQITPGMAMLDTGMSLGETRGLISKMYPNKDWTQQRLMWVLLKYDKPPVL